MENIKGVSEFIFDAEKMITGLEYSAITSYREPDQKQMQFIRNFSNEPLDEIIEHGIEIGKFVFGDRPFIDINLEICYEHHYYIGLSLGPFQTAINMYQLYRLSNGNIDEALEWFLTFIAHESNHSFLKQAVNIGYVESLNDVVTYNLYSEGLATYVTLGLKQKREHYAFLEEDNFNRWVDIFHRYGMANGIERVCILEEIIMGEVFNTYRDDLVKELKQEIQHYRSLEQFLKNDPNCNDPNGFQYVNNFQYKYLLEKIGSERSGPFYSIGAGMWKRIEDELGKEKVSETVLTGPENFIMTYNQI